jgi:predicted small secreted protein
MNRKIRAMFLSLFLLTSAGAILSACNTVHGAGEDLEHGSDDVKKAL